MRKLILFAAIAMLVAVQACQKEELQIGETTISLQARSVELPQIPFADSVTLATTETSPDLINWKLARKMAIVEFEDGFKTSLNATACTLSERPVIIYGQSSLPLYYEFPIVNQSGEGVATITTFARPTSTSVVAYALPYVRDYTQTLSKGVDCKIFSANYPASICTGLLGKSGDDPVGLIDADTGAEMEITEAESYTDMIDFISSLSSEDLAKYAIDDKVEYIAWLTEQSQANSESAIAFWAAVREVQDSLLSLTDEQLVAKCNADKGATAALSYKTYIIPEYSSSAMQNTRWNGWCGPSALAWIYRGQYSSYGGTYIPLVSDAGFFTMSGRWYDNSLNTGFYHFLDSKDDDNDGRINHLDADWCYGQSKAIDGGLYDAIATHTSIYTWGTIPISIATPAEFFPVGPVAGHATSVDLTTTLFNAQQGPTWPWQLGRALSAVTENKLDVKFVLSPWAFPNIEDRNLPVIINIDKYAHYVTAFGTKHEYSTWTIRFTRWFSKSFTIPTFSRWFLVHDNGATTSKSGYKPYWRSSSIWDANLHYNVVRN